MELYCSTCKGKVNRDRFVKEPKCFDCKEKRRKEASQRSYKKLKLKNKETYMITKYMLGGEEETAAPAEEESTPVEGDEATPETAQTKTCAC